ncbi:T9SS type A sorting domain-containing protein [Olleya namhaensis]|uniref:T9SS type A sorting domain-containing protein n=1 Tax=Olleya namhaensis TaxID=1144750 RepID=UPI0024937123|nr:T9SS type A sorting domain-containing protein [Olleya namhaensis]
MKKTTFLFLFLFLTTSFAFSQVLIDENFDAGLSTPTGWSNTDLANGGVWSFANSGEAPGFGAANTVLYDEGFSGSYPIFDSDAIGNDSEPEDAYLESPTFDASALTDVQLTFNHVIRAEFAGNGFVEVFDGTAWVQVVLFNSTNNTSGANELDFGFKSYNVSAQLAGVSNAKVRFRWVGDYSYFWAFDNVKVFSCTETTAPTAATATTPANGATNVAIDVTGTTPLITPFNWTAGPSATVFNLSLGTDTAGTDIGTIDGATNGNGITFNWAYDTTYYWSVESFNCFGSTVSAVWSFTTEADPALSAASFEATTFSLYPNPAKSSISIKSKAQLTSIEIFNQLGQRVMQVEADSMIENTININDLKSGIYFMKIFAGNQEKTMKFIKE